MTDTKNCARCGNSFGRNPQYSQRQWDLSQFCGRECSSRRYAAQNPMDGFFVNFSINTVTRCWNWEGAKDETGYGMFRRTRAHRHIYAETVGDIPEDKWVLHRCDNPSCVNPTHLFLGNRQDNIDDMHLKGRANKAKGEDGGNARLTVAEVYAIREDQRTQHEIARQYGIAQTTVSAIKGMRIWAHV